nr:uncharacterized protein LOC117835301 [Setaria viridis]
MREYHRDARGRFARGNKLIKLETPSKARTARGRGCRGDASSSRRQQLHSGVNRWPTTRSVSRGFTLGKSFQVKITADSDYETKSNTETDDDIDHMCEQCIDEITDFDELKSPFKKYANHSNKKYNKVVRERHDLAKKLDITKEKLLSIPQLLCSVVVRCSSPNSGDPGSIPSLRIF